MIKCRPAQQQMQQMLLLQQTISSGRLDNIDVILYLFLWYFSAQMTVVNPYSDHRLSGYNALRSTVISNKDLPSKNIKVLFGLTFTRQRP
jgi:hypothetical protein